MFSQRIQSNSLTTTFSQTKAQLLRASNALRSARKQMCERDAEDPWAPPSSCALLGADFNV